MIGDIEALERKKMREYSVRVTSDSAVLYFLNSHALHRTL
jgi:hypothetical protein